MPAHQLPLRLYACAAHRRLYGLSSGWASAIKAVPNVRNGWKPVTPRDKEFGVKRATVAFISLSALSLAACSPSTENGDLVGHAKDDWAVVIRSPQLQGLCYVPASFRANGNLQIDDLPAGLTHVEKVTADKIDELDRILSRPHTRVIDDSVTLPVPRDSVLYDPFYLQLVLFDCDRRSSGSHTALYILSAATSLPLAHLPSEN